MDRAGTDTDTGTMLTRCTGQHVHNAHGHMAPSHRRPVLVEYACPSAPHVRLRAFPCHPHVGSDATTANGVDSHDFLVCSLT